VEARAVSSSRGVRPFYRVRGEWGPVVAASMPAVLTLKEKSGGQWGGVVIRWGMPGGRRACHAGGRMVAGRPGWQHAMAPDWGGGSVLLDRRNVTPAFYNNKILSN
jgi:hypothetical protein